MDDITLYMGVSHMLTLPKLSLEFYILSLLNLLREKDLYTFEHSLRVANYSIEISKQLDLPSGVQTEIFHGALVHDIGKLSIPATILQKPSKLTDEERLIVNQHPVFGYEMLSAFECFSPSIKEMALLHHERLDGEGYPFATLGNDLSLNVKIVSVADSFDAMTSFRAYRKDNNPMRAIEEIERKIGTQFDALPAKALIRA